MMKKIVKKKCMICNNSKFILISDRVRDSKKQKIGKCKKCSHIQMLPIPTPEEERSFYTRNLQVKNINYQSTVSKMWEKSKSDTTRRINFLKKNISKNKNILEIGSGYGFFLERMTRLGYKITGIELTEEKIRISKRISKARVLDYDLTERNPDIGKFDAIVMFHVLEHIINPVLFLKKIKELLKTKGKLIIEVPNADDFQLNFNKKYREWYWQRAHIHYFTPKILKKILQKAGYKNIKLVGVQRYSIENFFNWKLIKKPQLGDPTYNLDKELAWLERLYKNYLEKNFTCDTIVMLVKLN